ncbi:MAG: hypothetical protein Q9192_008282 [Flavoplaca navasiana]
MVGADQLRTGLKEGDLPESAKRDVPAAVEYYSASTSTSTPSSDVTLNYLKCKDFCKFDKSSPPTCLPNCYVIDGQIQLDAPLLLIPSAATLTTSEASIDTSMTTFQTSTTAAVPKDTLLASREYISEKSLDKREDVVPDAIPRVLTDRTNTPAINTAAFRKLEGNTLAAITVEAAKKVGNKAAGHNGKRTESDHTPKGSAVEDSYVEGEDKKDKRAIQERGLDVSQNLPKGNPIHSLYGGDRGNNYNGKCAEERGFDLSEHVPEDMNPLDIRSNTLPPHRCGSAMCLLRRAFNTWTSKRDAPPKPTNILVDDDALTDCLTRKIKLRDCMQEFIVHEKRLVGRDAVADHPPPQSTNPHHVAKPKAKHPAAPKSKPKPKPKTADTYECGGAVVCRLKRALRMG